MGLSLVELFLYFSVMSAIGWVIESVYRSILERRLVNSGFLNGPFVPIYGFGAVLIGLLASLFAGFPQWVVLLFAALVPTVLEYVSSFILEKLFGLKLWDYSHEFLNLHGRISLKYSLFWMVLTLFLLWVLEPFWVARIKQMDEPTLYFLGGALSSYFLIDTWLSSRLYFKLGRMMRRFRKMLVEGAKQLSEMDIEEGHSTLSLKKMMRALRAFPNLSLEFFRNRDFYPVRFLEKVTSNVVSWAIQRGLVPKSLSLGKAVKREHQAEFDQIAAPIIQTPAFEKLKHYHHYNSSLYEHSIRVAEQAFHWGKMIGIASPELVKGALLHDFFFYNWRKERPRSGKLHAFGHPEEALENAMEHFGPLTAREQEMILHHMWPLSFALPFYAESWVLIFADKWVALKEELDRIFRKKKTPK